MTTSQELAAIAIVDIKGDSCESPLNTGAC